MVSFSALRFSNLSLKLHFFFLRVLLFFPSLTLFFLPYLLTSFLSSPLVVAQALERHREISDIVCIERDRLRDEVVRLRDLLKVSNCEEQQEELRVENTSDSSVQHFKTEHQFHKLTYKNLLLKKQSEKPLSSFHLKSHAFHLQKINC